jgi:hypothetical protein
MNANETLLRESIRLYAQKIRKENKEADAEWMVDKIATALDAATNKDKDYQYAAAIDSDEFKKVAQDLKKQKQEEAVLKETFVDWLAGGARQWGRGIIDRRAGYLTQALKYDPKLQRMAKDAGLSGKDFESRVYGLMQKDNAFLKALASGNLRSRGAGRF